LGVITQPLFFRSMKLYIKSSDCVSAQQSFENSLPMEFISDTPALFYTCIQPEYKKFISPNLLRRMSPIIRNGVSCSMSVLKKAALQQPDAIIVGTALGCLKDTTSFLTQLIQDNENLPNPTHFIQSTHNTIAGQIALLLSCSAYNFTFSQNHNSFETALLDAQLLMLDQKANHVLVGGVDEMNELSYGLIKELYCYKNSKPGEGAAFFLLSTDKSKVEFKGVRIINGSTIDFNLELAGFGITWQDVDVLIGGDNDVKDSAYNDFAMYFYNKPYLWYKPFVGEYGTVSAQAFWLGTKIIEEQKIPACWSKNSLMPKEIKNVLIYNCIGNEHSLMLLGLNSDCPKM